MSSDDRLAVLKPLENSDEPMLVVNELYASVQGESRWVGLPCVFVRLAGCNLRCRWCDSTYTFAQG